MLTVSPDHRVFPAEIAAHGTAKTMPRRDADVRIAVFASVKSVFEIPRGEHGPHGIVFVRQRRQPKDDHRRHAFVVHAELVQAALVLRDRPLDGLHDGLCRRQGNLRIRARAD